jgi:RNA polymerase sigma-70 factor, ECF subfamily
MRPVNAALPDLFPTGSVSLVTPPASGRCPRAPDLPCERAVPASPPISGKLPVVTPELRAAVLGDHLDRLYRAAWAMTGVREDAEDLVQETYERVLRRPREIAREEDALPYLLGVLRNTWVDTVRSRARRPTAPLDMEAAARIEAPAAASSPVEQVAAREVFAVVATLDEEFRDVLAAVDVAGLSYAEAAQALDIPAGTVMSRLSRGRRRVAEALGA